MSTPQESRAGADNPAPAEAPLHPLIGQRWSPRAFSSEPLDAATLHSLLEAARWAPSSMNEQPWSFIVADRGQDAEAYARIVSALMPANAAWAGKAPVLIAAVARMNWTRSGAPNHHAFYDTGQAVAQLALQAGALGLAVHQMGGFDAGQLRAATGIPEGYEPVTVLAVGYPGDPATLSGDLRARETAPRRRRPLGESVHAGAWSKPWSAR
jgi:nitroreductase